MSLKSVYLPSPQIDNKQIRISGEEHRHLMVSRTKPGEEIEVFDGTGNVWLAAVESTSKRETVATVKAVRVVPPDVFQIRLGLALIRHAAFELAVEKVVELGVTRIAPFIAARSNASPPRTLDRWKRIIVEASKQSKRYRLPLIDEPVRFERIVRINAASKILFAERDGGSLKSALSGSPVAYLIGPEGGWTDSELTVAREQGWGLVSLGEGILKAETAAIAGAALIHHELGK